jgi:DNA primase
MNLIPRDFIQALLGRTDIVDLIDHRVPLQKKSNNNYFACCPFHAEKSASFSVSQNKQFYHCFGCGAHGNAIDFLIHYDRLSFPEAVEALAKEAGMEIPRDKSQPVKTNQHQNLYGLLENIAKFYQNELRQSEPAIQYLKKRGLSGTVAKLFGLGFAPSGWERALNHFNKEKTELFTAGMLIKKDDGGYYDRFRERIMFPIKDQRGRIVGFGGRILHQGEPKYLNSPETPIFQKGHELYGLYEALQTERDLQRVIIVEGYMDVIALFQHGITHAVATLGTATTAHHLTRLFRHTEEIIFCFDGDAAGRTAAERAMHVTLPIMRDDFQVRFMFLPENDDPDSFIRKMGKEAFEECIQKSMTLSQFFFHIIGHDADLSHVDGRARFVKLAKEHLDKLPEGIFQQMMFDELAKKARIDISKPPSETKSIKPPKIRTPSNLRLAITLLVQQPTLALELNEALTIIEIPGFVFLMELIDAIRQHAITTTGALMEHWRDRKEEKLLAKFANVEHMIPEAGIQNEFLGAIKSLKMQAYKVKIDKLLTKAAIQGLSAEEKLYLNDLIQKQK